MGKTYHKSRNRKPAYIKDENKTKAQNDEINGLIPVPSKNGHPFDLVPVTKKPSNYKPKGNGSDTIFYDYAQKVADYYARCGILTKAALLAGVSPNTVKRWKTDNYKGFADSLAVAEEMYLDFLDDEAAQRGKRSDAVFLKRIEALHPKYAKQGAQNQNIFVPQIKIEGFNDIGEMIEDIPRDPQTDIPLNDTQRIQHHDPEITKDDD